MKFAIIYGDGTIYEGGGEDDEWVDITLRFSRDWLDAPLENVQAVVENGTRVWRANDWYYAVPEVGEFCSTDRIGNYLRGYMPWIKHGLTIPTSRYQDAMAAAHKYKGYPNGGKKKE